MLLLALLPVAAAAQVAPDTLGVQPDSAGVAVDTIRAPTAATGVPVAPADDGGPDEPVTYTASDSLIVVLADRDSLAADATPDDRVALYGTVEARYGGATLTAGQVEILLGRQEARARPLAVADTGAVGLPRFSDGTEGFTGREIVYNFGTRRGRVVGARTAIEGGFLLGGVVKQVAPDLVYASDAGYTTCNLDHPHYQLVTHRLMVDGDYVYSGPVQLRILGIPMPLWLPFGYFPAREGRRSGPLPPGYGSDPSFGLYLENVGYYWAASDYFDLLGRAKLGTRGSLQFDARANYVRRYRYDGALDVSLARLRSGERDDPDFSLSDNLRLRWSHQQTFSPTLRLSSAVDLSSNAQRVLSNQYDDRVAQTTTSTVSLSQNWPRGGRQLGVDLRATQQLTSGGIDATFPTLSFSQQRRFPFHAGARSSEGDRWYEKIGVSYNGSLTNTYRFAPDPDSVLAPQYQGTGWIEALFDYDRFVGATGDSIRFNPQATHTIPISASYTVNRLPALGAIRLQLAPSVRYVENWYARSEVRSLDSTGTIRTRQVQGFTDVRRVSLGVSASTEAYGTFPLRIGPIDGVRHILRPQAVFEFEPDYSGFGYVRTYTGRAGEEVRYPIVGGVPTQQTARLGFSLGNVFQVRRVQRDSTAENGVRRTVTQVLAVNLRSAYDFAAEVRPLSDLSFDVASELGERFRFRLDGAASAYALDSLGTLTPATYFSETGFPYRPTRLSMALGTALRSRTRSSNPSPLPAGFGTAASPIGVGDPLTGQTPLGLAAGASAPGTTGLGVVDQGTRWSLALDLTYSYTPALSAAIPARHEAILSLTRFELGLPFGMHLSGASGFDLVRLRPATTQLQLVKDLHCWEARLNVVPFGAYRQFGFAIYVKSGFLRDLLRLDFSRGSGFRTGLGGF